MSQILDKQILEFTKSCSMKELSLYFHVPFCHSKCLYCDFYSGGERIADWPRLIDAFLNEMRLRSDEWKGHQITSIYIGGGTPSIIPDSVFSEFAYRLMSLLDSQSSFSEKFEFTIESNPEDITLEKVRTWKNSGVNRVSIGVQTFNDGLLKFIGRRHTGHEAEQALRLLIDEIGNVSADLIFGLPGQSEADLMADLEKMKEIHPQHISVYSLMYEEGTALTFLRNKGKIEPISEEITDKMFTDIIGFLKGCGYEQYEISNYSLDGFRSKHNYGYWIGRPYIGIGPSAHSFDGFKIRKSNPADIKGYLSEYAPIKQENSTSIYQIAKEELTVEERMEERIMLGLRLRQGLSLKLFEEEFGESNFKNLLKNAQKALEEGNLELTQDKFLKVSEKGIMITDSIIIDLI